MPSVLSSRLVVGVYDAMRFSAEHRSFLLVTPSR